MKKFEASTLEEAYALAASDFCCSVTELEIQIIQNPSRGILGFGRKNAIILSEPLKKVDSKTAVKEKPLPKERKEREVAPAAQQIQKPSDAAEYRIKESISASPKKETPEILIEKSDEPAKESDNSFKEAQTLARTEEMFENLYAETPDIHAISEEIQAKIDNLFACTCFNIDDISVGVYDDETILIEFNGEDAALLIGKEGYRYKALAYLLYNWIHSVYGYKLRLEIAQFLHNQELMIENYLEPIIQRVDLEGRAQTKALDGILVQIALRRLRELFPQKYVAVRTNKEGGRYIIINEFMEKR